MRKSTIFNDGIIKKDSKGYKWWLLVVMMLGTFMAVLDSTIVNVALPTIIKHYGSSIEYGQWIVSTYLISMAIMLLSAPWFGERFGYKTIYLVGMIIFTIGSLLCVYAPSLEVLVAARLIEGFGSGIVQPLALVMILREFSVEKRGLALGFWAMASGAAVSLGPFLGGYLIQDFTWNSIFLINVPVGIISIIGIILIIKELKVFNDSKFDLIGFILLLIWIPLLLYSLTKFGNDNSNKLIDIGLIAVALITLVAFILYELKQKNPLINLRILGQRNFALTMMIIFLYGMALLGGNYILPEYLQHTLGYSVFESGVVFLPVGIIQVIMSPISGAMIKKLGEFKLIAAGMVILASYFIVSINFGYDTPKWLIMLSLYLRGLGIGISFTALNTLSFKGLSPNEMGYASGISNTIRQISGSLSVALLTSILVINTQAVSSLSDSQKYLDGIKNDFSIMLFAIIASFIPLILLIVKKKS